MDEFPPEQLVVFLLIEMEGIPFKELAEQPSESVNTLQSSKRYAVLHLRERLLVLKDELLNY